jgi:2-keto-3-deoxy-6-phosphogluconate aldolase
MIAEELRQAIRVLKAQGVVSNSISSRISKIRPPRHWPLCPHCATAKELVERSGIGHYVALYIMAAM